MSKWKWLSERLCMFQRPLALILLLVVADYLALSNFLGSFFQLSDAQKQIFPTLVTLNSVILAAAGIMYQVQATNERETQFKIHQQRKETYEDLIRLLENVAKITKENGDLSTIENDYRKVRPELMIYASPQIIKAYREFEKAGTKRDPLLSVRRVVELYQQ